MVHKAEWALVLGALAIAVPLWLRANRAVGPGDVVEEPITLVPEDRAGLACRRALPVGRYTCAFGTDGRPSAGTQPSQVIAPYVTTERALYLVAGLFEEPAVSTYVSRHGASGRFVASCKLRLVELVDDYELRFGIYASWGRGPAAWVAEPVSCVATRY